jgi:hypothetical protein
LCLGVPSFAAVAGAALASAPAAAPASARAAGFAFRLADVAARLAGFRRSGQLGRLEHEDGRLKGGRWNRLRRARCLPGTATWRRRFGPGRRNAGYRRDGPGRPALGAARPGAPASAGPGAAGLGSSATACALRLSRLESGRFGRPAQDAAAPAQQAAPVAAFLAGGLGLTGGLGRASGLGLTGGLSLSCTVR